jgi:hypothetical protein
MQERGHALPYFRNPGAAVRIDRPHEECDVGPTRIASADAEPLAWRRSKRLVDILKDIHLSAKRLWKAQHKAPTRSQVQQRWCALDRRLLRSWGALRSWGTPIL